MAKITQDMKDIAAKSHPFIFATVSKEGKPNGVPIGIGRIISDDEIVLADIFMYKTRQNIDENPMVAVSFWSEDDHYGYQFKGKARVETSGKLFDETVEWLKDERPQLSARAIVVVKVEEIYYIGKDKDSSINLA